MMKRYLLSILGGALALASTSFAADLASDNGSNYSGGWTNNSNGGTGFSAWSITSGGTAGTFIGDPSAAGISGMSATSFGQYAHTGPGSYVDAGRSFVGALSIGQTFSFDWAINWDSGAGGNKGFNLYSGGIGGTQLLNVNNANTADITMNGTNTLFGYGTSIMTWSFTLLDATTLQIQANDRDGTGSLSQNITVAGAPDSFKLYMSDMSDNSNNRQPYYNNFEIVPEPSTMVMGVMGAIGLAVAARRRMKK